MFDTFLEIGKEQVCLFVGYSFQDFNLLTLIDHLTKDGQSRPPHYILNPSVSSIEDNFWAERRFRTIQGDFATFITHLDGLKPRSERKLAALGAQMRTTPISRWVGTHTRESEGLSRYLASQCTVIERSIAAAETSASEFYRGDSTGWNFLTAELDVQRWNLSTVLQEEVLSGATGRAVLIKSYAGAGRTVFLKRLAWETAITHDRLCLYLSPEADIDIEYFAEIFRLTKVPTYIFIDGLSERVSSVAEFIRSIRREKWPATLFLSERTNEWNDDCDPVIGRYVADEYELERLTPPEIAALIEKLDKHNCLGELARLTPDDRLRAFQETYDGQLLVSLHEATHGRQFSEIIMDEYQSIGSDKARLLYLDICSLHRFGIPVRAGLISRIHDLPFDQFQTDFFKPLEKIVLVRWAPHLNDYIYSSRHRIIADLVYRSHIITSDEKFDNLVRLISKLNPSYSLDVEVLNKLIDFRNLLAGSLSIEKGSQIYDIALREFGEQAFIFHQSACFVNAQAKSLAQIDHAVEQLNRALELQENNTSFKHTEAEISLKRSRIAPTTTERTAARNRAISIAKPISENAKTAHAFHTIAKARIDALEDAIRDHVTAPSATSEDVITANIHQAQQDILRGLRRFPGDARLLTSQSELYTILAKKRGGGRRA